MSLRSRILLLFLGLAILPLLIVAGFGHLQVRDVARDNVAASLDRDARTLLSDVDAGLARLHGAVDQLARSPELREITGSEEARVRWEASAGSLEPLAYVTIRSERLGELALAGAVPPESVRCGKHGAARLVGIERRLPEVAPDAVLEARVWADDLLVRGWRDRPGRLRIVPAEGGAPYLDTSCESASLPLESPLRTRVTRSSLPDGPVPFVSAEGEKSLAVFRRADAVVPLTAVAHAGVSSLETPLRKLQVIYWVFVGLLATGTGIAFSLLLGRYTRSLEELTRAADRIGDGQLSPWLPPPGPDEVGRLSLAFNRMLQRLKSTMERNEHEGRLAAVGEMASYVAHEVRNPLSSIRMNLQSLRRDLRRGRIPEHCREPIQISLDEVDRLSGSVEAVLQLGRPTRGTAELLSLHHLLQDVTRLLEPEFRAQGIRLEMALDADADRVRAVAPQLRGVFLNLLRNAIDAQPDGGLIAVRSRLVRRETGPTVRIGIRDRGHGVPPELRTRIFEPFFSTKGPSGSGIGLAAARSTIRHLDGDLYLEDLPEVAQGSEFVVELPLASVSESRPGPGEALGSPANRTPAWASSDGKAPSLALAPLPSLPTNPEAN